MTAFLLFLTLACLSLSLFHNSFRAVTRFIVQLTVCVIVIHTVFFQVKYVATQSMLPNIQPGQRYIVQPLSYGIKPPLFHHALSSTIKIPNYGDIVATRYPPDPSYVYVKRVVALPGDEVRYLEESLYVNGVPVTDGHHLCSTERIHDVAYSLVFDPKATTRNVDSYIVPPDHVYLLGDNRDHSQDSRYWGAVPISLLEGQVVSSLEFTYPFINFDYQTPSCDMHEDDFVRITDYYQITPRLSPDA